MEGANKTTNMANLPPEMLATFFSRQPLRRHFKKVCGLCSLFPRFGNSSSSSSTGHSVVGVHFSSSPIYGELSWTEELIRRLPRRATAALNINETRPGPAGQLGQPRTDTASHHYHRRERRRKLLASARGR